MENLDAIALAPQAKPLDILLRA